MSVDQFRELFEQAIGNKEPLPYQARLALCESLPSLLDVPTGLGKTAAAVMAWVWRRRFAAASIRERTPRRLVYCLPMRVLVEQTYGETVKWLHRLGLLAERAKGSELDSDKRRTKAAGLQGSSVSLVPDYHLKPDAPYDRAAWAAKHGDKGYRPIAVHLLLGGEEATDWALWPELDAILIGTQDMLISRALNRGYAARRPRWPVEFGLLHNDAFWVFDEVQLMGSGLATTAQLEAFAKKLWRTEKPSAFLWMSATLGESFLQTRDRKDFGISAAESMQIDSDDRATPIVQARLNAPKVLEVVRNRPTASTILAAHPRGRISLVMANTVGVAKNIYGEMLSELAKSLKGKKQSGPRPEVCLFHSRFRQSDRDRQLQHLQAFLQKVGGDGIAPDCDGLIVISTQVLEAGVDLSAARLWSEIAPWPSMLQRLGRLNRDGLHPDATAVFWMPKADEGNKGDDRPNAKRIGPYEKNAVEAGRKLVEAVVGLQSEGLEYREALDKVLATPESRLTLVVEPEAVIRPNDFFGLFSTEPDLAGGFTNVSQFVRGQDRDVDVRVYWRDFNPATTRRVDETAPGREELCAVPYFELRQFLAKARVAWEWNFESGEWELRRAGDIQPGMTLLLPRSAGGYRADVGWTGDAKDQSFQILQGTTDDDSLNTDFLSGSQDWISLADHLADVKAELDEIRKALDLCDSPEGTALILAAHWHDWGKSLEAWQNAVKKYVEEACEALNKAIRDGGIPGFDAVASEWHTRLRSKVRVAELWAKFPDVRNASQDERLDPAERIRLYRELRVPFRPNLRHEAASALAAWQAWQARSEGLTALAVYLTATHHEKVRTMLRSTRRAADVFGVADGMRLQPVAGFFPSPAEIRTDAKYVGAAGAWDDANSTFTISSPSWLQMVSELLGPSRVGDPLVFEAISEGEPRALGPLRLAYFEALLRAADVRASRVPGRGSRL